MTHTPRTPIPGRPIRSRIDQILGFHLTPEGIGAEAPPIPDAVRPALDAVVAGLEARGMGSYVWPCFDTGAVLFELWAPRGRMLGCFEIQPDGETLVYGESLDPVPIRDNLEGLLDAAATCYDLAVANDLGPWLHSENVGEFPYPPMSEFWPEPDRRP